MLSYRSIIYLCYTQISNVLSRFLFSSSTEEFFTELWVTRQVCIGKQELLAIHKHLCSPLCFALVCVAPVFTPIFWLGVCCICVHPYILAWCVLHLCSPLYFGLVCVAPVFTTIIWLGVCSTCVHPYMLAWCV